MENARQGNTGRKKIAWAEGNLLFVPVIGFCLVAICLRNFDKQTDVHMEIARQENTGCSKLLWLRGTLLLVSAIGSVWFYFFCEISTHRLMCVCVWKMQDEALFLGIFSLSLSLTPGSPSEIWNWTRCPRATRSSSRSALTPSLSWMLARISLAASTSF